MAVVGPGAADRALALTGYWPGTGTAVVVGAGAPFGRASRTRSRAAEARWSSSSQAEARADRSPARRHVPVDGVSEPGALVEM